MVYNSEAQKLAIKAIGTVESNLNYVSINYADPITVGFMQWFGTRAASLLGAIRTTNAASWVGVEPSLITALDTYPSTNTQYWANRYLTAAEGESLKPVLNNNRGIQNTTAVADMEVYKDTAIRQGMNPDTNTLAMIFFFSMYHQSPKRALAVLASCGPSSSLDRLHAAALNEPVLGRYRSRYDTVRRILLAGDTTGVGDVPGALPTPPVSEGDDGGSAGQDRPSGDVSYVTVVGDSLHIRLTEGRTIIANPDGHGRFLPAADTGKGAVVPPLPPTVPTPGPGTVQSRLVAWMTEREKRYNYSQGGTRLEPDKNGYTDCSGLVRYAYQQIAGIEIGTYTGDQYKRGQLVVSGSKTLDTALLAPGDLIFYNWVTGRDTVDHVEMYMGNGKVSGHPGPGKGPFLKDASWGIASAKNYYVRRHV